MFWIPGVEKKRVNTKTGQVSPFFGFQELRKNMSTPKLIIFRNFWIPGVEKKHVNTKTSQFSHVFWIPGVENEHVNTKTSQFSTFFEFQELNESMCIYIYMCIYVHLYITWFCYIWRVVVPSFSSSAPKLVNFPHFVDARS